MFLKNNLLRNISLALKKIVKSIKVADFKAFSFLKEDSVHFKEDLFLFDNTAISLAFLRLKEEFASIKEVGCLNTKPLFYNDLKRI